MHDERSERCGMPDSMNKEGSGYEKLCCLVLPAEFFGSDSRHSG